MFLLLEHDVNSNTYWWLEISKGDLQNIVLPSGVCTELSDTILWCTYHSWKVEP